MNNQIIYVSFQGINNGIPQGMNKLIVPLVKDDKNSNSTLFVGYIIGKQSPQLPNNIKPIGNGGFYFLIRIISVLNRYLFKKKVICYSIFFGDSF